jgi:hypothetical protein
VAGFSLASTHYRDAMSARLGPIRDFLLLFFFIDLGSKLDMGGLGAELGSALVLSLFVLIGNPLIVMAIMGYMGYRKRTGMLAGLTVAQISEFSIVFIAMGISLGHVGADALGLTTLVGLVTITLSTYMILHSQRLYDLLSPYLGFFERRHPHRELRVDEERRAQVVPSVVVFGLGRYGRRLLEQLHRRGIPVLGIDFDPELIDAARRERLPVRYGDAEDPALVESLPLATAQWVLSSLPEWQMNRLLLDALGRSGYRGRIAAVVRDDAHALALSGAGVALVINPFTDAADHAAAILVSELELEEKRS